MGTFHHSTIIQAPLDRVFRYHADLRNLLRMMPPSLNARIAAADAEFARGTRVRFGLRPSLLPLEVQWDSEIVAYDPPNGFTDRMIKGPMARWEHQHRFTVTPEGTIVEHRIEYGPPRGMIGAVITENFIRRELAEAFAHSDLVVRRELEEG